MLKIRRALISVWDKKGLSDFARKLSDLNIEIVSTGKTADLLKKSNIAVKDVAAITAFPEILSGRVKTLHPNVFGGVLANKKHPLHMEDIKNLGIQPFDLVVVNFYPFGDKSKENLSLDEMIEYIDIGGPAMLRAAAKNFKNVACIGNPAQYKPILDELQKSKGFLPEETLRKLATEAFFISKEYDSRIYNYFKEQEVLNWDLEKITKLRYGENPHQKSSLYKKVGQNVLQFNQLQGKEISFNNFLDLDAAVNCVREFSDPAAVIVKHASLCGVGIDKKIKTAYKKAYLVDTLSSFGGIISLNRKVDLECAKEIIKSEFKECVIAPSYSQDALKLFSTKKNMRILESNLLVKEDAIDIRATAFGCLLQDKDNTTFDKGRLQVVTKKKPTKLQMKDLLFAYRVVKHVKSNAIVITKNLTLLGLGGGQPSRVGSVKIALAQAKGAKAAVLASDGFFPKEDSVRAAYQKGIRAIIQPGGSIKDKDIIKLCDKLNMVMVTTGIRHFRH